VNQEKKNILLLLDKVISQTTKTMKEIKGIQIDIRKTRTRENKVLKQAALGICD